MFPFISWFLLDWWIIFIIPCFFFTHWKLYTLYFYPNDSLQQTKVIKSVAFSVCFLASYCLAVESTADILVCVMTAPQFWYFSVNRNRSCIKDLLSLIQRYLKIVRSCIFRSCITETQIKCKWTEFIPQGPLVTRDGNSAQFPSLGLRQLLWLSWLTVLKSPYGNTLLELESDCPLQM